MSNPVLNRALNGPPKKQSPLAAVWDGMVDLANRLRALESRPLPRDGRDGLPGPQGLTGERGEPGPSGIAGMPGERGPEGSIGPQGLTGERGDPGRDGRDGIPGRSIVSSRVDDESRLVLTFTDGSQEIAGIVVGPRGERGEAGDQGIQGIAGEVGPSGPMGPQGDMGPRGLQGVAGLVGPRGEVGPSGPQGKPGKAGPRGEQGQKGEPGSSLAFGETYSAGIESLDRLRVVTIIEANGTERRILTLD